METTTMGFIGYILGLYWDNGKQNGNYRDYRVYIGVIGDVSRILWVLPAPSNSLY